MKGIIFTVLENFIIDNYGDEKYEEILSECNLKTKEPFVGVGTYPDEDLIEMVVKTSANLGISVPEALRSYGKYTFQKLAMMMPMFVNNHNHPKDFLKSVDGIIHVEVNKLYKDAITPKFIYNDPAPDRLIITYYSERKLYTLMEGLLEGVAEYFKMPIKQTQRIYERDGKEVCDFELTFSNPN